MLDCLEMGLAGKELVEAAPAHFQDVHIGVVEGHAIGPLGPGVPGAVFLDFGDADVSAAVLDSLISLHCVYLLDLILWGAAFQAHRPGP